MFEELLAGAFRDLIEYRRELPPTTTAEAIREAVSVQARERGLTFHALIPDEYREEALPANARDFAHAVVDAAFANHGLLTVEQLLTAIGGLCRGTASWPIWSRKLPS
ncbi:MAG TPA: hypothetical protein VFF07_14175 [Actinomycetota bacterium]|nr:hypothetical protein [Actinomycetota bacterium]